MRLLFIGDTFGTIGRRVLAEYLEGIKKEFSIDVCIANGENCAGGRGVTANILEKLIRYGVDVVTGGNHSMAEREVFKDKKYYGKVLRPLNMDVNAPGIGRTIFETSDGVKLAIINLHGRTFIADKLSCPFKMGMDTVNNILQETPNIFIDFHAEATSEKVCLAHYLDGKVSAICGTHTHVQTADERILKNGTAFITDAGMTGPEDSAIGMKAEPIIQKYLHNSHVRFEPSKKGPMFNGVIIDIDTETGKAQSISRIFRRYQFND